MSCFRMTQLCGTCREVMHSCVRKSLTEEKDFASESLNSSCACACMQYILKCLIFSLSNLLEDHLMVIVLLTSLLKAAR